MISPTLDMLEESLEKKIIIMNKIREENAKQEEILSDSDDVNFSSFNEILDIKGEYIDELEALNEEFEKLFNSVKKEIGNHKDLYKDQIKRIQKLIKDINVASASIEKEEVRNKKLAEKFFSYERERMSVGKKSAVAAYNYYQTMSNSKDIPPQFMDQKN